MGFIFTLISLIMTVFVFVRALVYQDPVQGWPSLVCIILFIGGVQLFCIGIIGQYISKMYIETKSRPSFIIEKLLDDEDENADKNN